MVSEIQKEWANGTYTGGDAFVTVQLNAEAIGRVRLAAQLAELEYFDICGVEL
jgi:hypothetical protein